jgi:hypothetical protein
MMLMFAAAFSNKLPPSSTHVMPYPAGNMYEACIVTGLFMQCM